MATKETPGDGIEVVQNGETVTVTFKANADFGLSKSGKTKIVASTRGGHKLPGGLTLSVNAYRAV